MELLSGSLTNGHLYLLLFAALFTVNLLPPVMAETVIPFSATLFADTSFSIVAAIAAATAGLVLGTMPWYVLGRAYGEKRIKATLRRRRWLGLTPADVDRCSRWFHRYGAGIVLLGRLVPGARSLVSIPAGFHAMRPGLFVLWTTLGCLLWATALLTAGHWLAHAMPQVTATRMLLASLAVFALLYVLRLRTT